MPEEELGKSSTDRHPGCARSDNRASVHLPALIVTIVQIRVRDIAVIGMSVSGKPTSPCDGTPANHSTNDIHQSVLVTVKNPMCMIRS